MLSVIGVCVYVCVHAVKEKWLELSTPNLECTYALSGFPLTWTVRDFCWCLGKILYIIRVFQQLHYDCYIFIARYNIYISHLCYDVSVHLYWRIIANLGFKFRSHFTAHCGPRAACRRIISRHASQCYGLLFT